MCDEIDLSDAILFVDSSAGIYVPQRFARELCRDRVALTGLDPDVIEDCLAACRLGPDATDFYWESFDRLWDWLEITDKATGKRYTLYLDGDLWLVPVED